MENVLELPTVPSISMYTDREQFLLGVALPEETKTYAPVPHRVFIDELQDRILSRNLNILERRYHSNHNGQQVVGELVISSNMDPELHSMFSFTNSYDKSMKASVSGGAYVKVCSNGLYLNNVRFKKQHRGTVLEELYSHMDMALNAAEEQMEELIFIKQQLKEREVTTRKASELLGVLFLDKKLITSTQLNIVKDEMAKPSFDYGCKDSAYELLNHLTHSFKGAPAMNYMKHQVETSNFFVDEFGLMRKSEVKVYDMGGGLLEPVAVPQGWWS